MAAKILLKSDLLCVSLQSSINCDICRKKNIEGLMFDNLVSVNRMCMDCFNNLVRVTQIKGAWS